MATKREVMLAGTPAKLAHMLASDSPAVLAPQGVDQQSAALVETNFQVLFGNLGQGVRLRPASGQFLHFLFNSNLYTVEVYPDGTEYINDIPPGEPFLLEAFMTGVFAPARRQWIAGQLAGSADSASGPVTVPGPLGVGVTPPTDAAPGTIFSTTGLVLSPGSSLQPPGLTVTHILTNAYQTEPDAQGNFTFKYLTNGPAFDFVWNLTAQEWAMRSAPAGQAGQTITWTRVSDMSNGFIGLNSNVFFGSDSTAHYMVNAQFDPVQQNFTYTQTNMPAFDLVYDVTADNIAFRQGLGGPSNSVITWQRLATIHPGLIAIDPISTLQGGDIGGHFTVNVVYDSVHNTWSYNSNNPAFDLAFDATSQVFALRQAPPGTLGAPVTFTRVGSFNMAPVANQTNFQLLTNNGTTTSIQTVLLGPANSGPGGSGRVLYVPN
ncbi:MAG TPA: hypothetical protein VGF39_03850 [Stellaceae bacterium]|jgi:hypothetical protein